MVYNRQQTNMKKQMLLIATIFATLGAGAQNRVIPVDFSGTSNPNVKIPRIFSYGNTSYLSIGPGTSTLDGEVRSLSDDSCRLFNSNLQQVKVLPFALGTYSNQNGNTRYLIPSEIVIYNYDDNMPEESGKIYYTQTLFNNDSKFEMIKPIITMVEAIYPKVHGYQVINEENDVLFEISLPDGVFTAPYSRVAVVQIGGQCYIILEGEYWYRIDRQTQSIARVENVPFNVFPTVVDHSSEITIQLEEGANAREIVVVDAMGREVKSVPVVPGQREVKVSTSGLHAGMGFVSDRKHGAVKIIVR